MYAWIEMTGSVLDGVVIEVLDEPRYIATPNGPGMAMVATETVRWIGDMPVVVYVPEACLPAWRAEHETPGQT